MTNRQTPTPAECAAKLSEPYRTRFLALLREATVKRRAAWDLYYRIAPGAHPNRARERRAEEMSDEMGERDE